MTTPEPTSSLWRSADGEDLSPFSVPAFPEAVEIDPDYSSRRGYQPEFLGSAVPLPELTASAPGEPSLNRLTGGVELAYHHFSIIMNRTRKLAFFTAVNIDGDTAEPQGRDRDRWLADPRVPADEQTNEALYRRNDLDRGHLVRRLDPCWGGTTQARLFATSDTFHFTNCSPQHARFNQNQGTWAGLEDYVLSTATGAAARVTVFTGPVFSPADAEYRGVRLPKQFWKVVAFVDHRGVLAAAAYLLSQERLLLDVRAPVSFGAYRTFQVSVRRIEELTGLSFGLLQERDVLRAAPFSSIPLLLFRQMVLPQDSAEDGRFG